MLRRNKLSPKDWKALQDFWDEVLLASGFKDAEHVINGQLVLKQTSDHPYRNVDGLGKTSKEDYYRLISQKVHDSDFSLPADRLILALYAEGKRVKYIHEELQRFGHDRSMTAIRMRIKVYEMRWGLRNYTPTQLNRKRKAS